MHSIPFCNRLNNNNYNNVQGLHGKFVDTLELSHSDSFYFFSQNNALTPIGTPYVFTLKANKRRVPIALTMFVRVEIYHKYRLPINRKYSHAQLYIDHSAVARALTSGPRGREFESYTTQFP